MTRTLRLVPLSFFVFSGAACSVFGSEDSPESPVTAEAPPVAGRPSESELTEKYGVFVVAGKQDGDGTRARPVGTLARGIELAKLTNKRVYACAGRYAEQLVVAEGVSITGGLDCLHPSWSFGNGRSRIDSPKSPAIVADKIALPTRIERFDVFAPDAIADGASSIGLFATDSPSLIIGDATITAGKGASGANGTPGIPLVQKGTLDGAMFRNQLTFSVMLPNNAMPNTPGPTSVCDGEPGHDGEPGGYGGSGGIFTWQFTVERGFVWVPFQGSSAYREQPGQTKSGAAGADGADGTSATSAGTFSREGFVPSDGTRGTHGSPGKGGRGGSGLMPNTMIQGSPERPYATGYAGATGGAGGCPGLAGTEGKGGGASVGALLFASPVAFEKSEVVSAKGGRGGEGAFGSAADRGGLGGVGLSGFPWNGAQHGGRGGSAGISGAGAGGPSIAIVHEGGAPRLSATKLTPGAGGEAPAERVLGTKKIPAAAAGVSLPELAL